MIEDLREARQHLLAECLQAETVSVFLRQTELVAESSVAEEFSPVIAERVLLTRAANVVISMPAEINSGRTMKSDQVLGKSWK